MRADMSNWDADLVAIKAGRDARIRFRHRVNRPIVASRTAEEIATAQRETGLARLRRHNEGD